MSAVVAQKTTQSVSKTEQAQPVELQEKSKSVYDAATLPSRPVQVSAVEPSELVKDPKKFGIVSQEVSQFIKDNQALARHFINPSSGKVWGAQYVEAAENSFDGARKSNFMQQASDLQQRRMEQLSFGSNLSAIAKEWIGHLDKFSQGKDQNDALHQAIEKLASNKNYSQKFLNAVADAIEGFDSKDVGVVRQVLREAASRKQAA